MKRQLFLLLAITPLLVMPAVRVAAQGMGGAYGGAAALMKERMKRDRPADFRLLQKVRQSEVVVVRGQYDHVETVLRAVNVPHLVIEPSDLDYAELNAGQLLLINCPGQISDRAIQKVRKFVNAGGFLFTTDWSLMNVLEKAFPGYVEFNRKPTRDDVVEVRVLKSDHHFLQHVSSGRDRPKWWLEVQSYPIRVLDQKRVEVLMESDEMARKYGQAPIAVTFRYGDGQVLHIASHYYLQRTETRTAYEKSSGENFGKDLGVKLNAPEQAKLKKVSAGALKDAYSAAQFSTNIVVEKQKMNQSLQKVYTHRLKDGAILRISPSTASGQSAAMRKGLLLKPIQRQGDWTKVQTYAGDVGWVESAKVEKR